MRSRRPLFAVLALAAFIPQRAEAVTLIGADAGIVKQSADPPSNLKAGFGFGAHVEFDPVPVFGVGPYFLHYALSAADSTATNAVDATFNSLGVRARFILPIPGNLKPYAHAGLGYAVVGYTWVPAGNNFTRGPDSAFYVDAPLGVGVSYQAVDIFQLSLDVAYRMALTSGGDAYTSVVGNEGGSSYINAPTGGWSLTLGAAFAL